MLDLIPAYSIGALDDDERIALEKLLETDAEAQQQLQEYEEIAELLVFATPERSAPEHLKADLKARLAKRPKLVEKPEQAVTSDINVLPKENPPQPSLTIRLLTLAAAILILVLGLGFAMTQLNPDINANEVLYNDIVEQSNISRFELAALAAENAEGEFVVASNGDAVLRIESLPDTTEEESYQLWIIEGDSVQSAGLFHWDTGHGPYFISIEQPLSSIGTIAMTIEPLRGSPLGNAPTGDILFGVEVSS
ncbi:MAG: anti-sigma factor [Phototrophicaceae bacterium]